MMEKQMMEREAQCQARRQAGPAPTKKSGHVSWYIQDCLLARTPTCSGLFYNCSL